MSPRTSSTPNPVAEGNKVASASSSTTTEHNADITTSNSDAEAATSDVDKTDMTDLEKEVGEALQWVRRVTNDLNGLESHLKVLKAKINLMEALYKLEARI